jgi:hypothetical protein
MVTRETKVSLVVAVALILIAFFDLRIAAGLAAVYLIASTVYRLRKRRSE